MAQELPSFALIIFGGTGDLARTKVYPALYDLFSKGLLPAQFIILGIGRSISTREEYAQLFKKAIEANPKQQIKVDSKVFRKLAKHLYFYQGDLEKNSFYPRLRRFLDEQENAGLPCKNRLLYLATYPKLYPTIFKNLKPSKLNICPNGWTRIMTEKPFGHNFETARELNELVHKSFSEDQIFRIDHYLGKETMQNILTFRFGNNIFEPIWNRDFVEHIQITALEDYGIRGRGPYYDATGALRDMLQNHLLEMLAATLMDPPVNFDMEEIRRRRTEIIKTLNPFNIREASRDVVAGQYESYRQEPKVSDASRTETFIALKTFSDDEHWKDVPIYMRTGKKASVKLTEINVVFKPTPHKVTRQKRHQNILTFRIEPNEGIALDVLVKEPGHGPQKLAHQSMDFCYKRVYSDNLPDPYSKLILDAVQGDRTSFNRDEEVEAQWEYLNPILQYWEEKRPKPIPYEDGTDGPDKANELIRQDGRTWIPPRMWLCRI